MKIYVAGSFAGRDRIRQEAEALKVFPNVKLTSKWYDPEFFVEKAWDEKMDGDVARTMAMVDIESILPADLVIIDTFDKSTTGGMDTELGIALMLSRQKHLFVAIIGPINNIFQNLADYHFDTWAEFRDFLGGL